MLIYEVVTKNTDAIVYFIPIKSFYGRQIQHEERKKE